MLGFGTEVFFNNDAALAIAGFLAAGFLVVYMFYRLRDHARIGFNEK